MAVNITSCPVRVSFQNGLPPIEPPEAPRRRAGRCPGLLRPPGSIGTVATASRFSEYYGSLSSGGPVSRSIRAFLPIKSAEYERIATVLDAGWTRATGRQ